MHQANLNLLFKGRIRSNQNDSVVVFSYLTQNQIVEMQMGSGISVLSVLLFALLDDNNSVYSILVVPNY